MRHLLTGFEFSQDEYLDILETASAMKKDPAKFRQELAGRSGAIMFEKPSLRTRTTFELEKITVFESACMAYNPFALTSDHDIGRQLYLDVFDLRNALIGECLFTIITQTQ